MSERGNPFRWWWHWVGPDSPCGPAIGAVWFMGSLVLAVAILAPPLVAVGIRAFGWWWRLWL